MKQSAKTMTDKQLLELHKVGKDYVINSMQVSGTTKNRLGKLYEHKRFLVDLRRLEELETELLERKLI